jgi:hypothetical protein
MARCARIRDPVLVGHLRWDESECVGMHECPGHTLGFNSRHMTGDALVSRASFLMVRMLLESSSVRAVRARRAVTIQANLLCGLSELSIVGGPMYIVTRGTGNAAAVHHALRKVVSLHAILVRRAVGKIVEGGLSKRAVLQLPIVASFRPTL